MQTLIHFDMNIVDGTDKAGNLLMPYGVDTVLTIPGSLGFENEMESIQTLSKHHLIVEVLLAFTGQSSRKRLV